MNKTIPKSPALGTPVVPAGQWRLYELFVQSFHTWLWDETGAKYGKKGEPKANDDLIDHSGPSAWDAPGTSVLSWKVNSTPPVVSDITVNGLDDTSPVIGSGGSLNAVLRFNAYADNDQMPIVRLAVDWGDGTVDKPNVYQVQGWFKNRKMAGLCGEKTDSNDTKCSSGSNCRLRFGNSSDACEEGYYQFTHIYECKSNGAGWNASTQSCKFTPRVQVLDNWGWCNSSDGKGRWNDEIDPNTGKVVEDSKRGCYWKKDEPWTSFSGTVEAKL